MFLFLIGLLNICTVGGLIYFFQQSRVQTRKVNTSYLESLWNVEKLILGTLNFDEIAEKVTNTILNELGYLRLGYEIVVLAMVDRNKGVLKRVAISKTKAAQKFLSTSPVPFQHIEISMTENSNISIQALKQNQEKFTKNVADVLYPVIDKEFTSKLQNELGIKSSMIVPIYVNNQSFGVLIFSMTKEETGVTEEEKIIIRSFTQAVGLSIQNAYLFNSLNKKSKELEMANIKLQEMDKLKDDFVSIASHELRTPMTAIRSYAWMAINRPDEPLTPKMQKYLSRVLISTERLINLVNDMLNISRIESGRVEIAPKAFNMAELSQDVLNEVGPKAAEKNLHLSIMNSQMPQVFADPDKVHQVLLNLVGNALKFTPASGNITISFFTDGKTMETWVKDSGVGISKEDISHLFTKFGRLNNSYVAAATSGGTGLGLYISKSLIEIMKGRIWAESEGMGKGTTFKFSLPVATPEVLKQAEKYTNKVADGSAKTLEPVAI